VLQILKGQVRGDDQRPAAAVTAVNHVVDLFQTVLRPTLHAKIVQYQQRGAAEAGYVVVAALEAGGKVIEYQGKVRHTDGNLFLHERIGDISLGNKIKKQKKLVIMRVCGWMAPSG
jgi:uncharacterized protein YihD (DUF1040 family)